MRLKRRSSSRRASSSSRGGWQGGVGGGRGLGGAGGMPPAESTPLRAGSAFHEKQNAYTPPCGLNGARDLGSEGGKKGGFTSESSNTPLGRRTGAKDTKP